MIGPWFVLRRRKWDIHKYNEKFILSYEVYEDN